MTNATLLKKNLKLNPSSETYVQEYWSPRAPQYWLVIPTGLSITKGHPSVQKTNTEVSNIKEEFSWHLLWTVVAYSTWRGKYLLSSLQVHPNILKGYFSVWQQGLLSWTLDKQLNAHMRYIEGSWFISHTFCIMVYPVVMQWFASQGSVLNLKKKKGRSTVRSSLQGNSVSWLHGESRHIACRTGQRPNTHSVNS